MQILTPIFPILLCTFVASTLGTPTDLKNHTDLQQPLYVECGGVLTSSSGFISYKPATIVSPNERCVWTISAADAVGYSLDVLFAVQPQPRETGLIASCIRKDSSYLSSVDIKESGMVALNSICPILALTFFSGETVLDTKGFVIIYEKIDGNNGVSPDSRQYVVNDEKGLIRYPSTLCSNYTIFEVSSFVFTPPGNIYNPERKSIVTYSLSGLEGDDCLDNIRVFRFSPSSGWTHNESIPGDYICGDTEVESWIVDEILMLVFRSDISYVSHGFQLTYNSLPLNFV